MVKNYIKSVTIYSPSSPMHCIRIKLTHPISVALDEIVAGSVSKDGFFAAAKTTATKNKIKIEDLIITKEMNNRFEETVILKEFECVINSLNQSGKYITKSDLAEDAYSIMQIKINEANN